LCVDALAPKPSGIGRYTWELSQGLPHAGVQTTFYGRGQRIEDPAALLSDRPFAVPRRRFRKLRKWWDQRSLAGGLVHGPNYFLPGFADAGIITVHDLSVLRFPETHPAERVAAFEREFERSLRRAIHVITDTETVREEVLEAFGLAPAQVTAVHLGVDPAFRPRSAEELRGPLAALGLKPGKYGLSVATLEPRKKIDALVRAWRDLPRRLRDATPLVLAGGSGWRNERLLPLIEQGEAEGWLRRLGYVPEETLPSLYAGSALFAYPSSYEGFGLPPLEAMASGVPAVVARRSCLPEVCGDVPIYVDPDDETSLKQALERALSDSAWRSGAAERGVAHARSFTWNRCVNATLAVYQKAVKQV
jgi:alpha-1,3-rhamnosyl/mannosyltransferase